VESCRFLCQNRPVTIKVEFLSESISFNNKVLEFNNKVEFL